MPFAMGYHNCAKNPAHLGFIPVDKFTMEHLPPSMQTPECLESINSMVERTVKVTVNYTSINRPEKFPDSNSPYPFFARRNSSVNRIGTGFLEDNIFRTVEVDGKKCPCIKCNFSGNPATQYYEFVVCTATHLIFDDSEAKNAVFELFYDSEDRKHVKRLYGTKLLGELSQSEIIYTDICKILCTTHDKVLSDKLIQVIKKPIDVVMDSGGIIVSHPHGVNKHITVGKCMGIGFKFFKKGENNVRVAPGMDSTGIQELKQALLHTDTSQEEYTEFFSDSESFICGANVSFSVSLENRDGGKTNWRQFPHGTRFMKRNREIIDVPEGMEFDVDKLYCYTTYDTPTCPGSTGAGMFYMGERFTHVGHIVPLKMNRSGLIKAVECTLFGHDGGSSQTDEGYNDYISDVEVVCEKDPSEAISHSLIACKSKPVKPLDMLNENVVEFLRNMETCYEEVASHDDMYYHIQSYTEEESAICPDRYIFRTHLELEQVLNKLVFNKEFSADVANTIPEEILLSQEAYYWAVRYLEDCVPSESDGPYLYNPALRDCWFDQEISLPARCRGQSGDGNRGLKIKIYNKLEHTVNETAIETQSNFSYHYHGTNVVQARTILQLGIDLTRGKLKRDYSSGHGFYVSRDFYQASSWAHRGHGFPVVLVFKTQNDFFSDKRSHIHLRATDLNTIVILKHFRSGCVVENEAIDRIRHPSVDECDSISGPILFDLEGFNKENSLVLKSHQTCIRKQNCANAFYRHIDSIIFNP